MIERPPSPIGDRPMGVVDIVDGAFAVLRQRPRTMVAIMAALVVPSALVQGWLARNSVAGGTFSGIFVEPFRDDSVGGPSFLSLQGLVAALVSWLLSAMAGVPIARVVGGWLTGKDTTPTQALRFMLKRSWVVLAAFVMIHAIEAIATVLLILPGIIAVLYFSLVSPVIALEELGPLASMRRSMNLVRRDTSQVLGVVALTGMVSVGVGLALETLPSIGTELIGPDRAWPLISVTAAVSSLLLVPFSSAAMALTYLDLRFRTEGLDLELRASDLLPVESTVPSNSGPSDAVPFDTGPVR